MAGAADGELLTLAGGSPPFNSRARLPAVRALFRSTVPASSWMLRNVILSVSVFGSKNIGATMSEKRELSSEPSDMSELMWASERLRQIAPSGPVKGRIRWSAARLKWKYSRARDIWYADPRVALKAHELHQIEAASGLEYGRTELRSVEAIIANADALTMGTDPDFAGAFATALRAFIGAFHRPGTPGANPSNDD